MRSIWTTVFAVSLVATGSAAVNTRFCTQNEKQLANKLHEQNTDPAKSCYRAANGDITTLDTSRLCPLPECATWLAYMAANSPDCYYDSSNFAVIYAAKNADCTGDTSASSSASGGSSASLRSGSSGSESFVDASTASSNNSSADGSFSAMSEAQGLNVSMNGSIDSSAADSVTNVGGSASTASTSSDVDAAPTPTPTKDLTIEDTTAPSTDSSGSTTPAPTSSGASRLSTVLSFMILFLFAVTAVIDL